MFKATITTNWQFRVILMATTVTGILSHTHILGIAGFIILVTWAWHVGHTDGQYRGRERAP